MKGYIILLNGNITFFGLIWLVVIFYSFPAYMRKTAGLFGLGSVGLFRTPDLG